MVWRRIREQASLAGSATLHEAMGRTGALPAAIKPAFPGATIAGPAFTVRSPKGNNLWIHHAVYAAAPGDILVVDVPAGQDHGYWGEILSVAAAARQLGGLVINGGVRDVEALARVRFPVFAAAICINGTGKDPNAGGALGPEVRVQIGGINVVCGDYVVGDADGVVVVPHDVLAETVALADERRLKEEDIIARLHQGESTLDLYDLPKVSPR